MYNFFSLLNFENIIFIIFYYIVSSLFFFIFILITIALFTVVERKIMAALQKRKGPNVHGLWGSLQAFSDGLKLLLKEDLVPSNANFIIFRCAPIYTFFISLSSWAVIPFSLWESYISLNISLMYLFALSSLGVYGIILSGWASNSKYSFLGSLRSAAQMISYEVSIGFILICIILISNSLNISKIVTDQLYCWNIFPFFPLFLLFFISIIAETNRAPFDLPEAEAELVSGYNVEYGGISFALFFLAEYGNILLMSSLTVLFFFGGWNFFWFFHFNFLYIFIFSFKVQVILLLFIWIRVAFPRYRYDQLMYLGWKIFLPFSILILIIISLSLNQLDIFSIPLNFLIV